MELNSANQWIKVQPGISSEVWRGLEVIGQLQESVANLGDSVFSSCIDPLLSSNTTIEFFIEKEGSGLIFTWKASEQEGLSEVSSCKLQRAQNILEFLAEHLFQGIGTLTQIVGDATWDKLREAYMKQVVKKTPCCVLSYGYTCYVDQELSQNMIQSDTLSKFC